MNLEEIKQKRKEAELTYLKGRESLLDLQDCHNEVIAKLHVEIKQKELEIQMKRAEITLTKSKINNLKSVYQQTIIALAEEEKRALEQLLNTIEND